MQRGSGRLLITITNAYTVNELLQMFYYFVSTTVGRFDANRHARAADTRRSPQNARLTNGELDRLFRLFEGS